MAKDKKTKGRVIEIPDELNLQLRKRIIELEEIGIKTSIPDLIIKYAQIGFNQEKL